MTAPAPQLAAVLSTGALERLYSGLSVLVSTAAEGVPCAALAAFGGLAALLEPDLERLALDPARTPAIADQGRMAFARSLAELRATAHDLPGLALYACSASVAALGLDEAEVGERLDGVRSTPRFLREAEGAQLLFV